MIFIIELAPLNSPPKSPLALGPLVLARSHLLGRVMALGLECSRVVIAPWQMGDADFVRFTACQSVQLNVSCGLINGFPPF